MKARPVQRMVRVFYLVRLILVAVVCLLIGVSARQLFDAYGRERIPFLREKELDTEVHVFMAPQEDSSLNPTPVEPHWN